MLTNEVTSWVNEKIDENLEALKRVAVSEKDSGLARRTEQEVSLLREHLSDAGHPDSLILFEEAASSRSYGLISRGKDYEDPEAALAHLLLMLSVGKLFERTFCKSHNGSKNLAAVMSEIGASVLDQLRYSRAIIVSKNLEIERLNARLAMGRE